MNRRPPRSTRTDTLFPFTTLFRSIEGCIVPHVSVTIEDGSILRIPSNRMLKRADGGEPVTAREAFEAKAEVIISIKPAKIVSIKAHKSLGINSARAGELFDLIDKFAGYGFTK